MKKTFEFLYYCLYGIFKRVRRQGGKDEVLTCNFYSVLLATNTISLGLPLKFFIPKGYFTPFPYNVIIQFFLILIFIVWYFGCKKYFLKSNYYKIVLENNKRCTQNKNNTIILLGILYSLFTFISFIGLAMWISRIS